MGEREVMCCFTSRFVAVSMVEQSIRSLEEMLVLQIPVEGSR